MKIETLKKDNLKRNIIIGVFIVLIISALVLNFTRAKYRSTASVPIVDSEVNYVRPDLNIVAIVVDGESVDTMPDGNYTLIDTSYCTINGENANVTLSWDQTMQKLTVTPFTTRGTKCYLYFETSTTKTVNTILGNIEVNLDTPDFSKTAQASCSNTSTCEETNGIYEGQDDDGTTYYWRGNVDNNLVSFAGFYWRIIRVNGDGSIRLIYQGTSANTTGEGTQISTSAFNSPDDNMYVGYMYTSGSVHGLGTSSTIKGVLDTWYKTNIQDEGYSSYIDTNAGFCGDRTSTTTNGGAPNDTGGTGTTVTYYGARYRLKTNKTPTFSCSNSSDLYTTSSSSKGNKALTYPIGLITADEVAYAGGVVGTINSSYYLYTNQAYWTMSPSDFYMGYARVFYVAASGVLGNCIVDWTVPGVRPVINLSSSVTVSGSGTTTDPYTIS